MTVEERNHIQELINNTIVEVPEPMNLEQLKAFVTGFESAQMEMLDIVDRAYRNMKTD